MEWDGVGDEDDVAIRLELGQVCYPYRGPLRRPHRQSAAARAG